MLISVIFLIFCERALSVPIQNIICNHDGRFCVDMLNSTEEMIARKAFYENENGVGDMMLPVVSSLIYIYLYNMKSMPWSGKVLKRSDNGI